MHTKLELLMQTAEDHYLHNLEMLAFKTHITALRKRVEIYKILRDHEIAIFQPIADQLVSEFPHEESSTIERALKHWISVVRYSAMAMLQDNPEFLQHRLLEWLTDTIQAHELQEIERRLYQQLSEQLGNYLTLEQLKFLHPLLALAEATLLQNKASVQTASIIA